jgi:hypothetical protein
VINAATQVGGSIGTAILNTLAVTATATYLATHTPSLRQAALVHGYATATAWAAGLLAAVAVLVYLLIPAPRPHTSASPNGRPKPNSAAIPTRRTTSHDQETREARPL